MSYRYGVNIFDVNGLEEEIGNMKYTMSHYQGEEEQAAVGGILFTLGGFACPPAWLAGIIATGIGWKVAGISETCQDAINLFENYKDLLQNNSDYDKIKVQVRFEEDLESGEMFLIPDKVSVLGIHTISSGWMNA